MIEGSLLGKIALITASSTGIGLGIANRLAYFGARVIISSRNQKNVDEAVDQINQKGYAHKAEGMVMHVANKDDRQKVFDIIKEKYGFIDILVCNAAVSTHMGDIFTITEQQYDKMFDTNVKSTFFLTKLFVPIINKGGSIIIISSFVAFNIDPEIAIYSVTKTALLGLTKALAKSLTNNQIRVNAVAPGLIRTKFASALIEQKDELSKRMGITQIGEPDDIANAVAFLVSDSAKFVNGECLQVTGDVNHRL